jgi:hypothetical protein
MSKGYQTFPVTLRTASWASGGSDVISFDPLPATFLGGIAHVAKIEFHVTVTPTDAGGATLTVLEANDVVSRLSIRDGINTRFEGSFNLLRFAEMLQRGDVYTPDQDQLATTEAGYFVRTWEPFPSGFAGSPSDGLLPVASLKSGAIELGFGSMDAAVDSYVAEIRTVVHIVPLYGELRIPPLAKWTYGDAGSADVNIPGKALHHSLALFNSSTYDAIAAGDFANIMVTGAAGNLIPSIHVTDLGRSFQSTKRVGQFTHVQSEPRAATDDNAKIKNDATPTAIVAATANVAPILTYGEDQQISKLRAYSESQLRMQWSGSQGTARWLSGRIEAQAQGARVVMAAKALSVLGLSERGVGIKTLSKRDYKGDLADFMPWSVKVG